MLMLKYYRQKEVMLKGVEDRRESNLRRIRLMWKRERPKR